MKLQVLLSTLNMEDKELLNKMNIHTDVLVVNQCEKNEVIEYEENVKIISMKEKGIGLSRNTALENANGEICIFADDDIIYLEDYDTKVIKAFEEYPKADVLVFNIKSSNPDRPEYQIGKKKRLHQFNCLKYGTVRIAIRLDKVKLKNIHFSTIFGGGTGNGPGEDTLFIRDCIKNKLNVYAVPIQIGTVKQESSTWFTGYDESFFENRGFFYNYFNPYFSYLLCIQYAIFHYKEYKGNMKMKDALKYMLKGRKKSRVGSENNRRDS